jgi:hypothetical protein
MNSGERRASGGAGVSTQADYQFYRQPVPSRSSAQSSPPLVPPSTQSSSTSAPRAASPGRQSTERLYRYVVDLGDEQFDIGEHLFPNMPSTMSPTMLTTLLAGLQSGIQPRIRNNLRTNELGAIANLLVRLGESPIGGSLEPVIVRPTSEQIARATEIATPDTEHDCAICQDTIGTTQQCRKILHCGHWFHRDCIDPWFSRNVQCPICRYDIREYRANEQQQQQQQSPAPPARNSFPEEDYH